MCRAYSCHCGHGKRAESRATRSHDNADANSAMRPAIVWATCYRLPLAILLSPRRGRECTCRPSTITSQQKQDPKCTPDPPKQFCCFWKNGNDHIEQSLTCFRSQPTTTHANPADRAPPLETQALAHPHTPMANIKHGFARDTACACTWQSWPVQKQVGGLDMVTAHLPHAMARAARLGP